MDLTLAGAFAAGLLTFLSPCVLPLAPVFTASLFSANSYNRWSRFISTLWFSFGFTIAFVAMGLGIASLSSSLGFAKTLLLGAVGIILLLFGIKMMGVMPLQKYFRWMNSSISAPSFIKRLPGGLHGLVFGLLFGLSWTPCVGPVLGGVLTYVASRELAPMNGALLLSVFSLGISLPLFAIAIGSEYVTPFLDRLKYHSTKVEYVVGIGLFVFGFYVLNQARLEAFPVFSSGGQQKVSVVTDENKEIELLTDQNDYSKMIFFHTETCPVCNRMKEFLPEFKESCTSQQLHFHRVDVGRSENRPAATHFNIRAVPTVSVINEKGHEVLHLVGYQPESRLREAAVKVSGLACSDTEKKGSYPPATEQSPVDSVLNRQSCSIEKAC